ncbi:MAG: TonB-dependent receptor [Rikenellaceae bacterium]
MQLKLFTKTFSRNITQNKIKLPFLICLLCIFAATPIATVAQNVKITGSVTGVDNEPIIGATIVMTENSAVGALTDVDGKFSFALPAGAKSITVSYLGYIDKVINVENRTNVRITLEEETTTMDEIQVIAYGTQSKLSVTGSMSNVGTADLLKVNNASVSNALAGNMTGVSSVQAIGQPGYEDATLYIRGSSTLSDDGSDSPLVLVDGVERSFSQLDPNEIADITVLKDAASTAVFGVRGANGVILVTTRQGEKGKPVISVSSNLSIQTPTRLNETCDSYTTAMLYNEQLDNDNDASSARFSEYALEMFRTGADPINYPDTDWREMIFKDAYLQTQHNVNISGGNDKVRYFTSIGYLYQDGLIKQFDTLDYDNTFSYNRFNYRANLDVSVTETTTMKINIGGVTGKTHEPIGHSDGLWRQINWSAPYSGAGLSTDGVSIQSNSEYYPVPLKTGLSAFYGLGFYEKRSNTLNMDLSVDQNLDAITKGLKFSIKGSYNTTYSTTVTRSGSEETLTAYYEGTEVDGQSLPTTMDEASSFNNTIIFKPTGTTSPLSYSEAYTKTRNWYAEAAFNYSRTFDMDHRVTGLVLYNQNRIYYPTASSGSNMDYQEIPRSYLGLVGRASYSYKNKYLFDASVGYNGSENFAAGSTRYGLFPSGSVGWIITEEKFMKPLKFISFLKVRASYGLVGNDKMGTSRFLYMPSVWEVNNSGYNFGVDVSTKDKAASEGDAGNPVITWETAAKQNYGIDVKFFDSRLSASVDVFYEHRSNILIDLQTTPSILGTSFPSVNLGELENKGYELDLKWMDKFKGGSYYFGTTLSYAKNKILEMDEPTPVNDFNAQTGRSTGLSCGYEFDRFYTEADFDANGDLIDELAQPTFFTGMIKPGDCKYVDLDEDGDIDANDQTYLGYSTSRPEYTLGVNYGLNWKGWSLSMQWLGVTNVSRELGTLYRNPFSPNNQRALFVYQAEDRWTPETAETATLPRFTVANKALNTVDSSLWVWDASYLRLKNVQIGYNFENGALLSRLGLSKIFVYASGYNLLTFDGIEFLDPEASTSGTWSSNEYPVNKTYTFGVNLTF